MIQGHLEKYLKPYNTEIQVGIDEVGRGCLFGPVYVGAVIWNNDIDHSNLKYIKDSKKLSKKKRNEMREFIEKNALAWYVASCDNTTIDEINILKATYKAMHKALKEMYNNNIKFDRILVDGNGFDPLIINNQQIQHKCIISGDNKYIPIAAASILAKTHRDEYIENLCQEKSELKIYGLMTNYGYGTKEHREAIGKHGYTDYHRKSFKIKSLSNI
jgi:ribonuclease HII